MKDYNNSPFYNSKAWKRASAAYMASKHYICERCGRPAQICHHKTYLNGTNVHDPAIALSFDNLEALCLDCHNAEHGPEAQRYPIRQGRERGSREGNPGNPGLQAPAGSHRRAFREA